MRIRRAKIALIALVLGLVGLIVLADSGYGQAFFLRVNDIPLGDKIGHAVLFGALSFLVNLLQRGAVWRLFRVSFLRGSAVILPLVTLEECSQVFFRSRRFDLGDLAADFVGVLVGGWVAVVYLRQKRKRVQSEKIEVE